MSRSSHPGQYSLTSFSIKEKMLQKTKPIKETIDELGTGDGSDPRHNTHALSDATQRWAIS